MPSKKPSKRVSKRDEFVPGVKVYKVFRQSRRVKKPKVATQAAAAAAPKVVSIGGGKNGSTRTIAPKAPKYYDADPVPKPLKNRRVQKPTKLRTSITPGTVLIVLAGRFAGKRVVFLKQLPSGLLLITGPFKINGVPIRRLNQVYCIATSTKVDPSVLPNLDKFTDHYFKGQKKAAHKKGETEFFAPEEEKKELPASRKADQKEVDTPILASIKKTPILSAYLNAKFSLSRHERPHELKF
mmetsp:Transcript_40751/g.66084  ORF Transcript_40751/g.66084 Transcript_40751/m.66084 type:complete len:240 (+) Transcript_40751:52-771(+)|eukprot:CAMPEP_0184646792 /NCGR_PEP_ID=MMETSP0308-20130426/3576_1 /TAXON_ID=38269 /ORGANISM="Gloeochaete witrockiana, Strain SAG 46.84" /LENGTH=239 /DNA_ID=CAMNT_0027077167 /DNA_START=48 /DNA_END=767 /DNA_ORIENTATION=-